MGIVLDGLPLDLLADGIQVLMCGVILACLLHNQLRHKRWGPMPSAAPGAPVFSQEVLLQALRQQAEQALASIHTVVENEQTKLQQLMPAGIAPRAAAAGPGAGFCAEPVPFRLGADMPLWATPLENRYAGLGELAAHGLTVRQIAAQTRLPAGEVELALTLQAQGLENGRQE